MYVMVHGLLMKPIGVDFINGAHMRHVDDFNLVIEKNFEYHRSSQNLVRIVLFDLNRVEMELK